MARLAGQVALTDALKGNFFLDLGVTLCFIEFGWSQNEEIVRLPRRRPHYLVYCLGIPGSLYGEGLNTGKPTQKGFPFKATEHI